MIGTTSATSSTNTGLAAGTTYYYEISAANSAGTSAISSPPVSATTATPLSIHSVKSGLVASDPLNNETKTQQQLQANPGYWFFGGDAPARHAPYDFYKDTQGLHIGIQANSSGQWAGFYGVTPSTNAALFHAIITTPVRTLPDQNVYYENALFVQTAKIANVNYVTCFSETASWGTVWGVFSATGDSNGAANFTRLYINFSSNQPLTRDCTIITNGDNYLKVYLDGINVYENHTMNLKMPGPFNAFLEPQSSYAGQLLNGTYRDYYVTSNENIQVTGLPSNAARVDLIDSSGVSLDSTGKITNGVATLDVGKYHFPLAANIKVYDSNNMVIASGPVRIFGGDVYSVS
jgi:hypothetical protein